MATANGDSTNGGALKKRSVVSSFIIKYPEKPGGKPMVALFRRSDRVSTYRHHLAPISGSIESDDPSPLAAAWRELQEETTLTPDKLELIRQGKSYTFQDLSIGREWTIYPFAYRLKAPESAIHIDWEHEGWGWYDPMAVEDTEAFGGVPRLAVSLRRAWFEKDLGGAPGSAGDVLAQGLERLRNDFQSGARELAAVALSTLRDVVQALEVGPQTSASRWWELVRLAAWHIWKNGRESMGAAIVNVLLGALKGIDEERARLQQVEPGCNLARLRAMAVAEIEQRLAERTAATSAVPVSRVLLEYLEAHLSRGATLSLLTLSESSTVAHILRQLATQPYFAAVHVHVLESRPLFEGVSTAAALVRYVREADRPADAPRVTVTLYTDASAALAAQGVDLVLLGADRIASTGAVSNKTGSLAAVLGAKQQPVPGKVVVAGETDKIAAPENPAKHVVEDNAAAQVTRAWASDSSERIRVAAGVLLKEDEGNVEVRVRNVFFEWVPAALVDAYVTEAGVWTVQDIRRRAEAVGAAEARMFGDV